MIDIWVEAWISRSGVMARIRRRQADILNDHGVNARGDQVTEHRFEVGQLAREDQGVERDVPLDARAVEQGHHLGQVGAVEVGRPARALCRWRPK